MTKADPQHRYRGTEIDGVFIEPDRLEIRGVALTDLIGTMSFAEAAVFVLGRPEIDPGAMDEALCAGLDAIGVEHPAHRVASLTAQTGAGMGKSVMAGLCAISRADSAPLDAFLPELPADLSEGLAAIAAIPALVAAWHAASGANPAARGKGFATRAVTLCASTLSEEPAAARLMEDVMVGWMAGFGPLPPSILIPRIAIGTGVGTVHALAAGFGASGPMHIGATQQAVGILGAALATTEEAPDDRILSILDRMLEGGQKIGGFGHPLFDCDPRPPCIRARAERLGIKHPAWALYDAAVARMATKTGLNPNVDFATGAAAICAGVTDPGAAAGLAMTARSVGMLAHALERKARPAFGLRRQTAREHLEAVPTGWL